MKRVWRLETKDGVGVYSCGAADKAHLHATLELGPHGRHPGPWSDARLCEVLTEKDVRIHECRFGFADIGQYTRWFYTEGARKALADESIRLRLYEVPDEDFYEGLTQAVFRPTSQRLLADRCPTDIY